MYIKLVVNIRNHLISISHASQVEAIEMINRSGTIEELSWERLNVKIDNIKDSLQIQRRREKQE